MLNKTVTTGTKERTTELVIKWFFEVYLKEEFGAGGFVYNPSKNDASWLDKCTINEQI